MGVIFSYRSSQDSAWFAPGGGTRGNACEAAPNPQLVPATGMTGVFGSTVMDMGGVYGTTACRGIGFNGIGNVKFNELGILMRIVPKWSGLPSAALGVAAGGQAFITFGSDNSAALSYAEIGQLKTGEFYIFYVSNTGREWTVQSAATYSGWAAGQAADVQLSWTGSQGTTALSISIEGAVVATIDTTTLTGALGAGATFQNQFDYTQVNSLYFGSNYGYYGNASFCAFDLNEAVLFDVAPSPTYTPRTGFYPCPNFDPLLCTDPGVANVSGNYVFQAAPMVGTAIFPTIPQVESGVVFGPAGSLTGTLEPESTLVFKLAVSRS